MHAIQYSEYGPPEVLRFVELPELPPKVDEVSIRIRAASVNPIDWHFMRGSPYLVRIQSGMPRPKAARIGIDVAGRIEAVGANVTGFRPGDDVFGTCQGSLADYVCAPQRALVTKPSNVSFEQAASIPVAGSSALQSLRDTGRLQRGQRVLINGAAGGVGTFAVQIAKVLGADVTGVCSTRNVEMVRSLGADHVIDYTREDFTQNGQRYDLILDMIGNHSLSARRRALTSKGTLVVVGGTEKGPSLGPLADGLKALVVSPFVSQRLRLFMARLRKDDLLLLRELLEAGKVTPVIDRTYPFREVPAAIQYLEEGHARGKVVITMTPGGES